MAKEEADKETRTEKLFRDGDPARSPMTKPSPSRNIG